jgi:hypothetical protein
MHAACRRPVPTAAFVVLALVGASCAGRRAPAAAPSAALAQFQAAIVNALAGAAEIQPGVTIPDRTTLEHKKIARGYLAGLLSKLGLEPKRQLVGVRHRVRDLAFVFFDEEERGMRGSRAFAQWLIDEKRTVHSVHTIDQMGWDQDGDRAIELELPYDGARELYAAAATASKMTIEVYVTTEGGSDHSSFRRLGFKAVGLTEEYHHNDTTPFIHRPGDTASTVNFAYLASTTRLMTAAIEMLATKEK